MELYKQELMTGSNDFQLSDYQQAIEIELDDLEAELKDLRATNRNNPCYVEGSAALIQISAMRIERYSRICKDKLSEQNQSIT